MFFVERPEPKTTIGDIMQLLTEHLPRDTYLRARLKPDELDTCEGGIGFETKPSCDICKYRDNICPIHGKDE